MVRSTFSSFPRSKCRWLTRQHQEFNNSIILGNAENRTRGWWVRSANAISVLCRPPLNCFFLQTASHHLDLVTPFFLHRDIKSLQNLIFKFFFKRSVSLGFLTFLPLSGHPGNVALPWRLDLFFASNYDQLFPQISLLTPLLTKLITLPCDVNETWRLCIKLCLCSRWQDKSWKKCQVFKDLVRSEASLNN